MSSTTPPDAVWRKLLPLLEQEIADELKLFRRSMRAAKILPDYVNRDVFPRSKSGMWEVHFDERTVEGHGTLRYTIYVRRSADQLAVNENGGHPFVVTSNFTRGFPWEPPTGDDLIRAMAARLRRYGVRPGLAAALLLAREALRRSLYDDPAIGPPHDLADGLDAGREDGLAPWTGRDFVGGSGHERSATSERRDRDHCSQAACSSGQGAEPRRPETAAAASWQQSRFQIRCEQHRRCWLSGAQQIVKRRVEISGLAGSHHGLSTHRVPFD